MGASSEKRRKKMGDIGEEEFMPSAPHRPLDAIPNASCWSNSSWS